MKEIYDLLDAADEAIQARCNSRAGEYEALDNLSKALRALADKVQAVDQDPKARAQ